jgi:hypothetical protein
MVRSRGSGGELRLIDADGAETGDWAVVCRPRSLLVTGSLDEFWDVGRLHKHKFESFERFRRSLQNPESSPMMNCSSAHG